MDMTVERLCNLLAKYHLLEPAAVRNLGLRWRNEAPAAADDADRFSKWLIAAGLLTDFQLGMLTRGFADLLSLGEYRLLDRIGQGRMAGVYRAVHRLGQVVAVKVLPPSKAQNPQLLARFLRESRLAVKLNHPNVVRTFQMGKTRADLHYLVMEYLDGDTLEDVLERRKRLTPAEAVYVLTQALKGLQHLDEQGMVHRDMKPGNVMLVPPSGAAAHDAVLRCGVKILDIGLGRALFDEGAEGFGEVGDVTNEGQLLGTPNYMAPEQARNAHMADIRADVYSLGCVFYHMLTGQPPFPGTNPMTVLLGHLNERPKPLRDFVSSLPPEFQGVIDGMLAKDPAQRIATPGQALKAVRSLAPQQPEAPPAAEPTPQMKSYLTWLELDLNGNGEQAPAPPPAPARRAAPAPAQAAVAVAARAAAPVVAPTPVARPAAAAAAAAPVARPAAQAPAPVPIPISIVAPPKPAGPSLLRPSKRELLYAAFGFGTALAVGGMVWLCLKVFG